MIEFHAKSGLNSMIDTQLIYLALSWILFCILHSLLIALPLADWLRRSNPEYGRYERVIYNTIALATLIPPIYFGLTFTGATIFEWGGWLRWIQAALILWALFLFWGGSRQFDTARFLGLRQLREKGVVQKAGENDPLVTNGVLNIVRHPWYSGGIAIVWARDLTAAALITNLVLTLYFLVGSFLEERRLLQQYGSAYQRYQRHVSMLWPYRWLMHKFKQA